jgi:hypothetical protein
MHATGRDEGSPAVHLALSQAASRGRCSCGGTHRCDAALDAIYIPEEDSRLHARAYIDFGQVPIGATFSARLAGNFNVRIHVPRALQQQITGNGLVGSVLGSARISADISERVGSVGPSQCSDTEVCLFVDFHEERRGCWMVDLRVLCGSCLRVPVLIDAASGAKHEKILPAGVVPIVLAYNEDLAARRGPITILSGSVSDLWRSVRDPVRELLALRIESSAETEVARRRSALRASLSGAAGEAGMERYGCMACAMI